MTRVISLHLCPFVRTVYSTEICNQVQASEYPPSSSLLPIESHIILIAKGFGGVVEPQLLVQRVYSGHVFGVELEVSLEIELDSEPVS